MKILLITFGYWTNLLIVLLLVAKYAKWKEKIKKNKIIKIKTLKENFFLEVYFQFFLLDAFLYINLNYKLFKSKTTIK